MQFEFPMANLFVFKNIERKRSILNMKKQIRIIIAYDLYFDITDRRIACTTRNILNGTSNVLEIDYSGK